MERDFKYNINNLIKERWSPRAFSNEKIKKEDIYAVLEAGRYAPSCFNEQPWRFIVGDTPEKLEKLQGILTDNNKLWAIRAPILILILGKKKFSQKERDNYWHMFDCGTAWGYMSLEAWQRGLITHGMGGFKKKLSLEVFNLSEEDYTPIAVISLGKQGNIKDLHEKFIEEEYPRMRVPLEELILP